MGIGSLAGSSLLLRPYKGLFYHVPTTGPYQALGVVLIPNQLKEYASMFSAAAKPLPYTNIKGIRQ